MALALQDHNAPPVERFHFPVGKTGHTVDAGSYNLLFDKVKEHCAANSVDYPGDQAIIDYLCKHTHVRCYDTETRAPLANKLTMNIPHVPTGCCGRSKK
jgi:hypothetical protein